MIEKTIGVIPPRNEPSSFPDKKAENSKDKKSEFESLLSQSHRHNKKPDKIEKFDQALGGIKKKVQDTDQKLEDQSEKTAKDDFEKEDKGVDKKKKQKLVNEEMVLGGMASFENVNKTPDSEENLDGLKKTDSIETLQASSKKFDSQLLASTEANQLESDSSLVKEASELKEPLTESTQVESENIFLNQEIPTEVQSKKMTSTTPEVVTPLNDLSAQPVVTQLKADENDVDFAQKPASETGPAPQEEAQPVIEKLVSPQPVVKALETEEIVPDQKVFETLNREHMFQKLETLKKAESNSIKSEARLNSEDFSQAPAKVQAETSTAFQSKDQKQEEFSSGPEQQKSQLASVTPHQSHVTQEFVPVTESHLNKPETLKDNEAANLKEILNQAQYLVTKGGGEVSVKMSPEGMGEVQLKVMLENGKMSVEMNTHDKNVQKLIQDSLSDLKSSLAAHQISVEHVTLNNKISTVNEAQNMSSSQNFTDGHAHHQSGQSHQRDQRQQAGQVLEHETMKALPLAKKEINKASANRIYQNNKANSLNAVA